MPILQTLQRWLNRKRLEALLKEAGTMALGYKLGVLSMDVQGSDAVYSLPTEITDAVGVVIHYGIATARVNNGNPGKVAIAQAQLKADAEQIMAQAALNESLASESRGVRDAVAAVLAAGLEG